MTTGPVPGPTPSPLFVGRNLFLSIFCLCKGSVKEWWYAGESLGTRVRFSLLAVQGESVVTRVRFSLLAVQGESVGTRVRFSLLAVQGESVGTRVSLASFPGLHRSYRCLQYE